jgi:hypothetical protein
MNCNGPKIVMEKPWRRWLLDHLDLVASWCDSKGIGRQGTKLELVELQRARGKLTAHFLGNPFKTAANVMPTIAVNWFVEDLLRKRSQQYLGAQPEKGSRTKGVEEWMKKKLSE